MTIKELNLSDEDMLEYTGVERCIPLSEKQLKLVLKDIKTLISMTCYFKNGVKWNFYEACEIIFLVNEKNEGVSLKEDHLTTTTGIYLQQDMKEKVIKCMQKTISMLCSTLPTVCKSVKFINNKPITEGYIVENIGSSKCMDLLLR